MSSAVCKNTNQKGEEYEYLGLIFSNIWTKAGQEIPEQKHQKFLWGERTAIKEAIAKLEIMQEAEEKADEDEDEDEIDDIMARL